jgi:hypothetical protein
MKKRLLRHEKNPKIGVQLFGVSSFGSRFFRAAMPGSASWRVAASR